MADEFLLDEMTDLDLSTTVPGWIRPYLQNYYIANKENGETINEFVVRIMGQNSLDYRLSKLFGDTKDEMDSENSILLNDYNSEVAKL